MRTSHFACRMRTIHEISMLNSLWLPELLCTFLQQASFITLPSQLLMNNIHPVIMMGNLHYEMVMAGSILRYSSWNSKQKSPWFLKANIIEMHVGLLLLLQNPSPDQGWLAIQRTFNIQLKARRPPVRNDILRILWLTSRCKAAWWRRQCFCFASSTSIWKVDAVSCNCIGAGRWIEC